MTDVSSACRMAMLFGWAEASIEPARHGHINDSFFVDSASGHFFLQRINRSVFADVVGMTENTLAVHRHLGGDLVPQPVPAPDGEWIIEDAAEVWRAFGRVEGAGPVMGVTPKVAEQAGRLLGSFHMRLAGLDPATVIETLPGFHDIQGRLELLRGVIEADPWGRVGSVVEEIEWALASAPLAQIAEDLAQRVPRRVTHNDAKLDNVLFRDAEAVCLVDLDTVMPGAWFWDIGDLLRSAATSREDDAHSDSSGFDAVLFDAVLGGYQLGLASTPLEDAEREAIGWAGALATYEQAVRFLTDWLAGDVYYRTDRPGQNKDRARAQLRLLASMPSPAATL